MSCRSLASLGIARDGHCHEAVMWLVHHVPKADQASLISLTSPSPLLPEQTAPEKKTCATATGTHKQVRGAVLFAEESMSNSAGLDTALSDNCDH